MPTMKIQDKNNKVVNVEDELAEEEGEAKQSMKKGPWKAAEDAILIEYVNKYGEGNWNSVQKNSGLSRCGKSCRLRWANHLRPNLKKGAFSQHEQQIIIDLHAKLGNKWARMASQLPGRTDNEIKNFWNTRMKRRQRAGLPLYPPEVQDEGVVYQQYSAPPPPQLQPQPQPQSHPSSFSFTSLLSSSNYDHHTLNHSDSAYDDTTHQLYKQNMGMRVPPPPIYSVSPYGFNYGFDSRMLNTTTTTTEMTSSTTQSQTPASSYTTHAFMGGSSINHLDYYEAEGNSSGLLDDLVVEAQALNKPNTKSSEDSTAAARKVVSLKRKSMEDEQTQRDDFSSSQSSTGKKAIGEKDPMEEMNSMDDDLFSLLNNYPSEMPMPEWYRKGQNQSLQHEEDASPPHTTDQDLAWTLGTCWNNMPTIC